MSKKRDSKTVAFIYAKSLFDVAVEAGIIAELEGELLAIDAALDKDPLLRRFLETPTVRFEEKRRVLLSALAGASQPLLNFLLLVIEHERTGALNQIVDTFHDLANTKAGIAEFEVSSARQLDEEEIDRLKAVLRRKFQREVALKQRVAPSLLGGLLLMHKDTQWDSSLVHRLGRLVNKLEEARGPLSALKDSGEHA